MAASSSLGPVASSTWRSMTLAVPGLGDLEARHLGRAAAGLLGHERLRPDEGDVRAAGGELGLHDLRATEDRLGDDDRVAVDLDVDVVGEHRLVELHRQAGGDVAAVVGGAEHDQVGTVAVGDRLGDRRGHRHAGERAAEVAGAVHLGGAVGAERAGDRVGVAPA